jgi:mono/diheme cytochrome c family protein
MLIRAARFLMSTVAVTVVATGCAPSPRPGGDGATADRMVTHFDAALALRDHAIVGDLNRFRATSRALAELEATPDLPPEVFLQFGPLRYEAELGSEARTNAAAALAAAAVAGACGDCHRANGISLPEEAPVPAAQGRSADVRIHMERLSRVTRQLWSGLVSPSETAWQAGAAGLIEVAGLPSGLEATVPADDLAFASQRLRRLAEEAIATDGLAYRVRALGEIWGTCADCHVAFPGSAR